MVEVERPVADGRWSIAIANLAAIALLIGSGLVHGRLTDRWGMSDALATAIARLDRLPQSIGEWQGRDVGMDQKQIERAGILGYKARSYHNTRDGRDMTVLLVCGRPGPIAVHTPDICYAGAGYEAVAEPATGTLEFADAIPARFFKARFRKVGALVPETLDILWTWIGRGVWEAPANPRLAFAHLPSLYKVYLIARRDESATVAPNGAPPDHSDAGPVLEAIGRALSDPEASG